MTKAKKDSFFFDSRKYLGPQIKNNKILNDKETRMDPRATCYKL